MQRRLRSEMEQKHVFKRKKLMHRFHFGLLCRAGLRRGRAGRSIVLSDFFVSFCIETKRKEDFPYLSPTFFEPRITPSGNPLKYNGKLKRSENPDRSIGVEAKRKSRSKHRESCRSSRSTASRWSGEPVPPMAGTTGRGSTTRNWHVSTV